MKRERRVIYLKDDVIKATYHVFRRKWRTIARDIEADLLYDWLDDYVEHSCTRAINIDGRVSSQEWFGTDSEEALGVFIKECFGQDRC